MSLLSIFVCCRRRLFFFSTKPFPRVCVSPAAKTKEANCSSATSPTLRLPLSPRGGLARALPVAKPPGKREASGAREEKRASQCPSCRAETRLRFAPGEKNRRASKHTSILTVALLLQRPAAPPCASRQQRPRRQRYSPPQQRAPWFGMEF